MEPFSSILTLFHFKYFDIVRFTRITHSPCDPSWWWWALLTESNKERITFLLALTTTMKCKKTFENWCGNPERRKHLWKAWQRAENAFRLIPTTVHIEDCACVVNVITLSFPHPYKLLVMMMSLSLGVDERAWQSKWEKCGICQAWPFPSYPWQIVSLIGRLGNIDRYLPFRQNFPRRFMSVSCLSWGGYHRSRCNPLFLFCSIQQLYQCFARFTRRNAIGIWMSEAETESVRQMHFDDALESETHHWTGQLFLIYWHIPHTMFSTKLSDFFPSFTRKIKMMMYSMRVAF